MARLNANWRTHRAEPYDSVGILKLNCIRCKLNQATQQWSICADRNSYRPICDACDIALNRLVLEFMKHPNPNFLMMMYKP